MPTVKGLRQRRLHKAFLRYHDPDNWPMLRKSLKEMGLARLIGYGSHQLIPPRQPGPNARRRRDGGRPFRTQHTGLPRNPRRRTR